MSEDVMVKNPVHLMSMQFVDIEGTVSCGFRIENDCEQYFNDSLEEVVRDDIELLKVALKTDNTILFDVEDNAKGMYINNVWYPWSDIKEYFGMSEDVQPEQVEEDLDDVDNGEEME